MKIISLEQGSQEWLDFRKSHITATDASGILGKNPWSSQKKIWQQKLGLIDQEPMNERMKRGQELEPIARDILIEETGICFTPAVAIHDIENWMMASLDGLSDCESLICEIKCPGDDTHYLAVHDGEIKDYYISQIQHQLFVTGADKCYYMSYSPGRVEHMAIIEVLPDQEYIDQMIEKERHFYETWIKYPCAFDDPPPDGFKFELKAPKK